MSAATAGRRTPQMVGKAYPMTYPAKAAAVLYAGCIGMVDSSGRLLSGATATGCVGAGRVNTNGGLDRWDNTSGSDGDLNVDVEEGIFKFANLGTDLVTKAELGKVCYIADNQTVAKTSGTNTRSPAGLVRQVDSDGVWVEFSLTATRQATV